MRCQPQQCVPAWPTYFSGVGMDDPHSFQTVLLHVSAVIPHFSAGGPLIPTDFFVHPSTNSLDKPLRWHHTIPYTNKQKRMKWHSKWSLKNLCNTVSLIIYMLWYDGQTSQGALQHLNPNLARKVKILILDCHMFQWPPPRVSALSHISVGGWEFSPFLAKFTKHYQESRWCRTSRPGTWGIARKETHETCSQYAWQNWKQRIHSAGTTIWTNITTPPKT